MYSLKKGAKESNRSPTLSCPGGSTAGPLSSGSASFALVLAFFNFTLFFLTTPAVIVERTFHTLTAFKQYTYQVWFWSLQIARWTLHHNNNRPVLSDFALESVLTSGWATGWATSSLHFTHGSAAHPHLCPAQKNVAASPLRICSSDCRCPGCTWCAHGMLRRHQVSGFRPECC